MLPKPNFADLSLRDLEYVQAVAEHRNFGQAALVCGISQPAISQQIRKLEARFGFPIFERAGRQFHVTSEGQLFLAGIDSILAEAEALLGISVNLGDPLEGELRLGIIPTLGPYLMPLVLRSIRSQFPQLRLTLIEEPTVVLEEMLQSRKVDLLLLASAPELKKLDEFHWFFENYVYVSPEDRSLKNKRSIKWDSILPPFNLTRCARVWGFWRSQREPFEWPAVQP